LDVATSVSPPLTMWVAYAKRIRGRAKSDLGDATGAAELDEADRLFQRIGNKLGAALLSWDRARLGDHAEWARAAWALGSLGLEPRVAQLLFERRQVRRKEIPSSTAGLTDREGVHHEQGHHPVGRGGGCGPGRVVGEAEVPTEPDKGGAHVRSNA
jgi:hypothetical protein